MFTDSASVIYGNGVDVCGDRDYSIVSTTRVEPLSSTELKINPTTGLISVYTENNATIGTHFVSVTAWLPNYRTVRKATATFKIKIEPFIAIPAPVFEFYVN